MNLLNTHALPLAAFTQTLCGALLLLTLSTRPVMAQTAATWKISPGTGDWNTAGNWVGSTVPNGSADTATFGTSSTPALSLSADTGVNGITLNSDANAYTLTAVPTFTLTLSGAGISNSSGSVQNFVAAADQGYVLGFGTISFTNSATAAGNTAFTNQGSTYGQSAYPNQYSSFGGGITQFFNTSQAGSGTFTNNGGSGNSDAGGGTTIFNDSSSASSGTFTNKGSTDVAAFGGITAFHDASNAGSAHFTNESGPAESTRGGYTIFNGTSSANSGTFTTNGGVGSGTMGVTMFNNSSNAGSAHFTTNGGNGLVADGPSGGYVIFNGTSSADTGNFTTNGGAIGGVEGGNMQFWAGTTAGNGTFTTNGGTVIDGGGGFIYFTNYLANYVGTSTRATADHGTFTTNGGEASGASGGYIAFDSATADHGIFTTNGGTASGAAGGYLAFYGNATGDHGTFTINGGTASGIDGVAAGGVISFKNTSDAASSTLIATGGTNGGDGGSIRFYDAALGGTAIVKVYGDGSLDISPQNLNSGNPVSVSVGSLEGSGNVFLGRNNLTVGSNGNSTTFSGVLQDYGMYNSGVNGSLTKIGTGTLTLTGANTYTGSTSVSAGTLLINNPSGFAFGTGAVTVAAGATLAGAGSFTGSLQLNGMLSPGNSPGTMSAGTTTFGGGGSFLWEINSVNGTAGQDPGWDLLSISGALNIAATSGSKFTVNLTSLTVGNTAGAVSDFSSSSSYSFTLASTTTGVSGFDANVFNLNTAGFTNDLGGGTWSIGVSGNDLNLNFTASAIPEPSTYAAIAGAAMLGVAVWRRRRRSTSARTLAVDAAA